MGKEQEMAPAAGKTGADMPAAGGARKGRNTVRTRGWEIWAAAAFLVVLFAASYTWFRNQSELPGVPPVGQADNVTDSQADLRETIPAPATQTEPEVPAQTVTSDVGGTATQAPGEAAAGVQAPAEQVVPVMGWPLQGALGARYGWSYSPTFRDWRWHDGLDIFAAQGSEVTAPWPGKVTAVEQDPAWGTRVTLEADNGLVLRFSDLEEVAVQQGDAVLVGDVIGRVGRPGTEESAENPHLHLEVLKDGQPMDPLTYIRATANAG